MTENLTKTAVPTLRFPEFENDGEWEETELRNLAFAVSKRNRDKQVSRVLTNSAANGIIDQRDFFDKDIATKDNTDTYFVVEPGDFVYNPRISDSAPVGPTSKNKLGRGIVSPLYAVFRFHDFDTEFYEHYFKSAYWHKSLKEIGNQGARHDRMGIGLAQLLQVKVLCPSPSEQQKIAATLSSLDDLIGAEREKLDALNAHKRGLMQGLFPAEGETVPRLRFAEFEGEWDEKRLGDVANIITGNTPSTSDSENYGGEKLFVSPADINDDRYIFQTKTTLSEKGYLKTRRLEANSILVVCIGSTIGKVAQNKVECATNQQINALIPNDNYSNDFIYSTLEFNSHKLTRLAGRQAVPIINKSTFSAIKMPFPSLEEQQKIAATLSSLDALITAQSETIEALKLHKKGLMQGLFPT